MILLGPSTVNNKIWLHLSLLLYLNYLFLKQKTQFYMLTTKHISLESVQDKALAELHEMKQN